MTVEASHDGFRGLPGRPCHRRRWSLTEAGLRVDDLITGRGRHAIVVRWHLAPGSALRLDDGEAVVTTAAGDVPGHRLRDGWATLAAESGPVAAGFGRSIDAPVLTCSIDAVLPVRVSTAWRRAEDNRAPAAIAPATYAGPATTAGCRRACRHSAGCRYRAGGRHSPGAGCRRAGRHSAGCRHRAGVATEGAA